jgi:hypothetical protein
LERACASNKTLAARPSPTAAIASMRRTVIARTVGVVVFSRCPCACS